MLLMPLHINKNISSIWSSFIEGLIGVALLWFLFLSILPSAKVTIKVAQHTEDIIYNFRYYPAHEQAYLGAIKQISIPYYT